MDAQLKRGMLETCVLAVLSRGDSYGYQIIKEMKPCIAISESTLYPVLKRLEGNQMVTVYSVEHNGRLRKYYKITQEGLDKIKDFEEEWKEVMDVYHFILNQKGEKEDE